MAIERRNSLLEPATAFVQRPNSIFDLNCCDALKDKKPANEKIKILGHDVEIVESDAEDKLEIYQVIKETDPKRKKLKLSDNKSN